MTQVGEGGKGGGRAKHGITGGGRGEGEGGLSRVKQVVWRGGRGGRAKHGVTGGVEQGRGGHLKAAPPPILRWLGQG